ncbi:MAG: phage baseplate assembly protein V, partial [Candidatus Binataceae bacterium]
MIDRDDRGAAAPGMFRVGIVQEQDTALARVRVKFADYDQLRSWWLPIVVPKTQNDKAYWIPDLGEQVVCLMDAH